MRVATLLIVCAAACGGGGAEAPKPRAATPAPTAPSDACKAAEYRQLDFWLGNWDVVVKARAAPDKDVWGESRGTQTIESILGGCVISEHFAAEGPPQPWAGKSYSIWQPKLGKWRQTWVDDQGSYLAFVGGREPDGTMALYGEPQTKDGKQIQMRMIWLDVTPASLRWEWQRSVDGGAYTTMMRIDYTRR